MEHKPTVIVSHDDVWQDQKHDDVWQDQNDEDNWHASNKSSGAHAIGNRSKISSDYASYTKM